MVQYYDTKKEPTNGTYDEKGAAFDDFYKWYWNGRRRV